MEKLNRIYEKDINREIQGVIKVDGNNYIKQELEEYVVTDEILKRMETFFTAYNAGIDGNTENMGVWISGFFGSGKSHFLKIISYLLENKEVDGKPAIEYFKDKIPDQMLLADIKRASSIPTDVILFNIDSKATIDSVQGKDNILAVFEKVFNEKMGLSTIPYVAELERFLIKEEKYEEFQNNFKKICDLDWKVARNDFYFRRDEVVEAYMKTLNKSQEEANNWFDKAEENYDISVEKFAERVKDYIESKGDNHHVVFLVDEIGQYIGTDSKLMLNLQTIVEDLGTYCGGKAWVIVTSQEAIDDVIKVIGDNFSKIQGRFKTKLTLSSSQIDEVIQKRILTKTPETKQTLEQLYLNNESVIKNLLTFSSNTAYQKIYDNAESFSNIYPFIPYQFTLIQDVFTDIRTHGFAGKHLSSGERSLLGAFQEAAKNYENEEIGTLIPFYAFFDTIEEFLDHDIMGVIHRAQVAKDDGILKEIDVRMLKMLFMLRNIKGLPANIDNLTTLYVSNINDDKITIKKEIQESLLRLEGQTLIQRNNDEFQFLTDEEQSINREIKKKTVDQNMISDYLKNIIYGKILTDNKFNYKNKIFTLTKYIDNLKCTAEYEIGIKVVTTTPNRDDTDIKLQSTRENNFAYIELVLDNILYDEIKNNIQIEQFIRDTSTTQQTEQVEIVIGNKKREREKQENIITQKVKNLLDTGDIIISGDIQNIQAKDVKAREREALEILVNNIFRKFSYINHNFTSTDTKSLFYDDGKQISVGNKAEFVNQKAYDEMKNYIAEQDTLSTVAITIRSLLQKFEGSPYGWADDDILYILTKLLKDEEIILIYNNVNQYATSDETLNKILKREYYDKTIIKLRTRVDISLINNLKYVSQTAFDNVALKDDEDGMADDFKEKIRSEKDKIISHLTNYNVQRITKYPYPGKDILNKAIELYKEILNIKETNSLFQIVSDKKDEIIEISKKVKEVLEFFDGSKVNIFSDARDTIEIYDKNKGYTDNNEELIELTDKIKEILTSEEPYSRIQELPFMRKDLISKLTQMYDVKSAPIIEKAEETLKYIKNELENSKDNIGDGFGKNYINTFNEIIESLKTSNELINIFAQDTRIKQEKDSFISALENEKNRFRAEQEAKLNESNLAQNSEQPKVEIKPIIKRKRVQTSLLIGHSYKIDSEEDIDKYLTELKQKLQEELQRNKNLTIE